MGLGEDEIWIHGLEGKSKRKEKIRVRLKERLGLTWLGTIKKVVSRYLDNIDILVNLALSS